MVARVVTITAAGHQVDQMLGYYAGLAADQLDRAGGPSRGPVDYYLDPNEPPGRWWGTGCPALGLEVGAPVLPEQLRALLEARHPNNGRRLGRGFGDRSARGFDATFSAPKSVSVLWGLTEDPWVRAEITAAQDAAVDAALAWIERHGLVTRRGYRGVDQVDAHGLAVGVFRQHTSRTVDPQLHTHAVIASKVLDACLPTGARCCPSTTSRRCAGSPTPGRPRPASPCAPATPRPPPPTRRRAGFRTAHRATLADQVARQHDGLTARGRTVAITTASAGTARAINVEIQHRRNPTRSGPNVAFTDGTVAFAGDQIATRRNDPTLLTAAGAEVRNRHTWTITTVHRAATSR